MTGSYFSTIDGPANRAYLEALRRRTAVEPSARSAKLSRVQGLAVESLGE